MGRITFFSISIFFFLFSIQAQETADTTLKEESDTLTSDEIIFTPAAASNYIVEAINMSDLWKPGTDSIKIPLSRLIEHYNTKYDSVERILSEVNYQPSNLKKTKYLKNDTLALRWLNDSTFIIDTLKLGRDPLYVQKTIVKRIKDSVVVTNDIDVLEENTKTSIKKYKDTLILERDIVYEKVIDTALLKSRKIQLYQLVNKKVVPDIFPKRSKKYYHFLPDGSKIVLSEPVHVIVADDESPFFIVPDKKMPDSLSVAVQTLLSYIDNRDSIPINLRNIDGKTTPFWLTANEDELQRYWVKNQNNDSVSIWMGNPDKRNITMLLEDDIILERVAKETVDNVPFTMATPQFSLAKVTPFKEIPVYWDFGFSGSFSLSQNYLDNWAKGGEPSITSLTDVKVLAKYSNKEANIEWTSSARLKYGSIKTNNTEPRPSTDILEFDSKLNKGLRKKYDFSSLFHWKTQIAENKSFNDDGSWDPVSNFLNPATFTVGAGIEYKPVKKSTINFSVLSYKNTFVLDTVTYDQTNHGIDKEKRAKQEMGGQLLIQNEFTFWDDMKINNSLRLFSNYLEKPQNVDVEWEIDLEKQLSLYFTVLLNLHMIYDDDIRFNVLDDNDQPILNPDGTEYKVPKLQFKQYLGITFLIQL